MTGSTLMVSFHTEEMNSMNAWCELKAALTFHSEMAFMNKLTIAAMQIYIVLKIDVSVSILTLLHECDIYIEHVSGSVSPQ